MKLCDFCLDSSFSMRGWFCGRGQRLDRHRSQRNGCVDTASAAAEECGGGLFPAIVTALAATLAATTAGGQRGQGRRRHKGNSLANQEQTGHSSPDDSPMTPSAQDIS
jgi:hypothetical protein